MKQSNFSIHHQGEPIVEGVSIFRRRKDVVLIFIDMKTKYCTVLTTYGGDDEDPPGLYLEVAGSENLTLLILTDFAGWDVFSVSDAGKYTIRLTLIKNNTIMKKKNNITAIGAGSPSTGFPRTMGSNVYTAVKYPELLGKSPVKKLSRAENKLSQF